MSPVVTEEDLVDCGVACGFDGGVASSQLDVANTISFHDEMPLHDQMAMEQIVMVSVTAYRWCAMTVLAVTSDQSVSLEIGE